MNSSTQARAVERGTGGTQDRSGWGLLGMTLGILLGFFITFYFLVPLFPKSNATLNLTLMTTLVIAAMTAGGAVGYLALRRKA